MAPTLTTPLKATIADTETTSALVDLGEFYLCGVLKGDDVVGSTLTFQVSEDGTTFVPMVGGTSFACTSITAEYVPIPIHTFAGVRFIRVIAGTQTSDVELTLFVQPL